MIKISHVSYRKKRKNNNNNYTKKFVAPVVVI